MPTKRLIPVEEVFDALRSLQMIELSGEDYYDQDAFQRVFAYLLDGGDLRDQLDVRNPVTNPPAAVVQAARDAFGSQGPAEAKAENLARLRAEKAQRDERPLGPCFGCEHRPHPGDECGVDVGVDPDGAPIICECDDYVDSTVRGVPVLDERGELFPCMCGHAAHESRCTEWRLDREENGQCLCLVYDPDRGEGPGDWGAIPPVPGPDPATLGFVEGRLMRNAPPTDDPGTIGA